MAKKKGGRRIWIGIFVLFSFLDEIPGLGEGALVVLFWVVIIGYALRGVLFGEKGFLQGGIAQVKQQLQETAIQQTEQYLEQHPNDPNRALIEEQLEAFQEKKEMKSSESPRQHTVSGNAQVMYTTSQENYAGSDSSRGKTSTERQQANQKKQSLSGESGVVYSNSDAQKNYAGSGLIVKDALTKTNRNPYSLDGR